ncbi:MAG: hypothetical protein WC437_02765 [Patescibacteria group bacterium]
MPLKINKFENIYGIKELSLTNPFGRINLIYASNGLMKSSFANAIKDISTGKIPSDRIFKSRIPQYDISILNKQFTEANKDILDGVIVFKHDDYEFLKFKDKEALISKLVISTALKKKYSDEKTGYQSVIVAIENLSDSICDLLIGGHAPKNKETVLGSLVDVLQCHSSWRELILTLSDDLKKYETLNNYDFFQLFNDKTEAFLSKKDIQKKLNGYVKTYNNKLTSKIFSGRFGPAEIERLRALLIEIGYFEAGHQLFFANEKYVQNSKELEDFISKYEAEILKDADVKKEYLDIVTLLEKNKDTREFRDIIKEDPTLLVRLADTHKLKEELIETKLSPIGSRIKEVKQLITDKEGLLKNLLKEAESEGKSWKKIVKKFNERFSVPFTVNIDDLSNTVLGLKMPEFIFKFVDKDEEEQISEEILKGTLSTGEKRALAVLHLLFDVEYAKNNSKDILIVLDDIVDSFDYRNKYSLVEYINEMLSNTDTNCIIMTHNYDFFRTCRQRLKHLGAETWIAYETSRGKIRIQHFTGNITANGLNLFCDWAKQVSDNCDSNECKAIALIPVVRNLLEIDKRKVGYEKLTALLHYSKGETDKIKFGDIKDILSQCVEIDIETIKDRLVFNEILKLANNITSNSQNLNLEDKLLLAMAIRLKAEEYMQKIFDKNSVSFTTTSNQTIVMFEKLNSLHLLTDGEKEILSTVIITTPDFIHVNSFMYEPLIDVSIPELVSLYNKVKNQLII